MTKIKSYEPYHIGIKFKPMVQLDILHEKISPMLKKEGYVTEKADDEHSQIMPDMQPRTIGKKDNVKIQLNYLANSINTVGNNVDDVSSHFNSLVKLLSKIEYDVNEVISFYEIVSNVIVDAARKPSEIFDKTLSVKSKILSEQKYPVSMSAVKFSGEIDDENLFEAKIGINPTNPTKTFKVSVVFRSKDQTKISVINKEFENLIEEITSPLKI